jgi:hypothetical protein
MRQGTTSVSEGSHAQITEHHGFTISASPNPATASIQCSITHGIKGFASQTDLITVVDVLGNEAYRTTIVEMQAGSTNNEHAVVTIPCASWPPGLYFIHVRAGRASSTTSIVKH